MINNNDGDPFNELWESMKRSKKMLYINNNMKQLDNNQED